MVCLAALENRVDDLLSRLEEAIALGQFDKAAVLARELAAIKRPVADREAGGQKAVAEINDIHYTAVNGKVQQIDTNGVAVFDPAVPERPKKMLPQSPAPERPPKSLQIAAATSAAGGAAPAEVRPAKSITMAGQAAAHIHQTPADAPTSAELKNVNMANVTVPRTNHDMMSANHIANDDKLIVKAADMEADICQLLKNGPNIRNTLSGSKLNIDPNTAVVEPNSGRHQFNSKVQIIVLDQKPISESDQQQQGLQAGNSNVVAPERPPNPKMNMDERSEQRGLQARNSNVVAPERLPNPKMNIDAGSEQRGLQPGNSKVVAPEWPPNPKMNGAPVPVQSTKFNIEINQPPKPKSPEQPTPALNGDSTRKQVADRAYEAKSTAQTITEPVPNITKQRNSEPGGGLAIQSAGTEAEQTFSAKIRIKSERQADSSNQSGTGVDTSPKPNMQPSPLQEAASAKLSEQSAGAVKLGSEPVAATKQAPNSKLNVNSAAQTLAAAKGSQSSLERPLKTFQSIMSQQQQGKIKRQTLPGPEMRSCNRPGSLVEIQQPETSSVETAPVQTDHAGYNEAPTNGKQVQDASQSATIVKPKTARFKSIVIVNGESFKDAQTDDNHNVRPDAGAATPAERSSPPAQDSRRYRQKVDSEQQTSASLHKAIKERVHTSFK